MTSRYVLLRPILLDDDAHGLSRFARDSLHSCVEKNVDPLLFKKLPNCLTHIFILFRHQPWVPVDDRNFATKSPHRLRHLYSDIAAPDDNEVFGNFVEFECLDVCERLCFRKARNRFDGRPRTRPILSCAAAPMFGQRLLIFCGSLFHAINDDCLERSLAVFQTESEFQQSVVERA
jgi:hypothetical protein